MFIIKTKTAYKLFRAYFQNVFEKMKMKMLDYVSSYYLTNGFITGHNVIINIYSIMPLLYLIMKIYSNNKGLIMKQNLGLLMGFNDSIYYSSSKDYKNSNEAFVLFNVLLPILTYDHNNNNDHSDWDEYIELLALYLYYLCYEMKSKLSTNDQYDPKLNLYFLLLALFD